MLDDTEYILQKGKVVLVCCPNTAVVIQQLTVLMLWYKYVMHVHA